MKKTIFLTLVSTLALLMSSCNKHDAPGTQPLTQPPAGTTSYTFSIYISGVTIYLSEHNEIGDRIHTTIIDNAEADVPYSYEAKDNTIKIKVYLKQGNWSRWVQQVYYLDKGNNIDIIITGNTLVGNYEP